jgi:hypothetical protein
MVDLDIVSAIREVAAEDRGGWSAGARSDRVLELLAAREQLDAALLAVVGEWDAAGDWALDGALTAASWLTPRTTLSTPEARALVRAARHVQANPTTAKALAAAEMSTAQVQIAARAARRVEDLYADHEAAILDAARITTTDEYQVVMHAWRSHADDHLGREPESARHARRHLHINQIDSMARIDGWVAAETGARFAAQLDALEPPDPVDGPELARSLGQRRADALTKLVHGERLQPTEAAVVIDLDSLQGRFPADLTHTRCDLLGGDPIDHTTALRMACDAAVSRVLTQGHRTILDLGRATPVVSRAQRRALAIRDGGCVEPGCTAPPEWCDAHHKRHWAHGGPTDLENLELRCRRHHITAHTHGTRGHPTMRC